MENKKDNKGRNNINKKDHQLKFDSLVDENSSEKVENQKNTRNKESNKSNMES